jgi:NAD(P)-dependent dehydrogenase (short-subunit alcohol dehydrogenase family)
MPSASGWDRCGSSGRDVLHDTKILMTGATGMVGRPIAMELARTNEVWAVGRFGDSQARAAVEDAGVRTLRADLADTDLPALPDVDYVLNFAVSRTNDWGVDRRLLLRASVVRHLGLAACGMGGSRLRSVPAYELWSRAMAVQESLAARRRCWRSRS